MADVNKVIHIVYFSFDVEDLVAVKTITTEITERPTEPWTSRPQSMHHVTNVKIR